MKRVMVWSALIGCAALVAPIVRADVKTSQRTQFKLAGVAGAFVSRFGGAAARDGLTTNVAVKGDRKASMNDVTGQIIDLGEQKVYTLEVKKKQYTVKTFAEIRAEFEKARADAQKQMQSAPENKQQAQPDQKPAQQMEFDVDVKETGQHKSIARPRHARSRDDHHRPPERPDARGRRRIRDDERHVARRRKSPRSTKCGSST